MGRREVRTPKGITASAYSAKVWPPERVAWLTHLIEIEGLTYQAAGERMSITKNKAIGKAKRLGLQSPRARGPRTGDEPLTLMQRLDALDRMIPRADGCRYAIGHVGEPGFHFCGKHVVSVGAWCEEHRARVYQRTVREELAA